jgi:hypothetical protein
VEGIKLFAISGQKEKNTNISLNWDLILAAFAYTFSNSISEDSAGSSLAENNSHFARFMTDGMLWDKRLNYNFSQQFHYTTQDISIEGPDGFFDLAVPGSTSAKFYPLDDPDQDPLDLLNYVQPNTGEDIVPSPENPLEVGTDQRIHIRFETGSTFPEEINLLRLILSDLAPADELQQAVDMQWDIYYRENKSDEWQGPAAQLTGEISEFEDDSIDISLNLPGPVAEVLLIDTTPSADKVTNLTIVSLQAFTQITQDFSRNTTGYLTNFGIGYRITQNLRVSSSMTLENNEVESADNVLESSRWSVSGNIRWTPLPYLRPSLGFSEYHEDSPLGPENISRSYSLTVSTVPLESMHMTFGATHSERYTGELKTSTSDRYTLSSNAQIYPDLTATWNLSYGENESLRDDGTVSKSSGISSSLRFNARLYRNLNMDLSSSYSSREDDTDTSQNLDAKINFRYRPSEILSLRGGYSSYFLDSESTDKFDLAMNLRLVNTRKTRLTFTATHTQADNTSDNFALAGSWDISKYMSLVTQGNFRVADTNTYNFRINLSLRL